MNDQGPVFIDQFGADPNPPPPGPWWKQGWQGRMELWRAFWICFVFGHGIVGGVGFGMMIFGMVLGFVSNPGTLDGGLAGLATGGTLLVLGYLVFAIWAGTTVWRCADNCVDKRWGLGARVAMVGYATAILTSLLSLVFQGVE
jgi:hypothetical protein